MECSPLRNPRDLAASQLHRCLYIMEVGRFPKVLVCLDAATGDVRAECDIADDQAAEGRNLSVVQRTGNVIVTCAKELVEYDHTLRKIRVIAFPAEDMDMLWQAVPLSDSQFVVCQVCLLLYFLYSVLCVCLCGSLAQCALSLKRLSAGPGFNPQTRQNKLFQDYRCACFEINFSDRQEGLTVSSIICDH